MGFVRDVVLFDGGCAVCDGAVRFIIARDRDGRFRYAPHGSAIGRSLRERHGVPDPDGVVLIEGDRPYLRSDAVLRIARRLGWPWCLLYALNLVPRRLRDSLYRWFARGRRRWLVTPAPAAASAAGRALI
jgi:predicted DCC family thiol-disulfide oxidoreductase YuxK